MFALGFLGGAYFSVSLLPGWLRGLSYLTPTRYALDALRDALFGSGDRRGKLGLLAAFTAVILPLALLGFRSALAVSRRRGTLTRG